MGTGIGQGLKLDLLALQLEWKPRGLDFPFFSGTGSARQICVFSFTDSSFLQCFLSSTESPTPMLSCFCIFLSRLRTRKQHFPQGFQLQKKLMPMRRMSFELLKRYVAHVGPLRLLFKSFGEKLHFPSQLSRMARCFLQSAAVRWPFIPFPVSFYHLS